MCDLENIDCLTIKNKKTFLENQKKINKASAETIIKLSKVLNCSVLDLMEFDNT